MATGCSLSIPHYVIKKGRPPRCSARQKLKHRKSILWPTTRGRDVSKRIMMEFTIVSNEIQFFRDFGWTEEKCIAMDKLAQEDHSNRLSYEEYERYQKHWYLTLNKSGKNAPMRLGSDFRTAVKLMNRGGICLLLPNLHGGSGIKNWWSSLLLKKKV